MTFPKNVKLNKNANSRNFSSGQSQQTVWGSQL